MTGADLSVAIGALKLKNPLLAASGTCGYGVEMAEALDLSSLGGIVTKGLYMNARDGCDVPRIAETPAGNSIRSPSRRRLALRTNACHRRRSIRLCSVAPMLASPRRPSSWAGITRVSLKTSRSPGLR